MPAYVCRHTYVCIYVFEFPFIEKHIFIIQVSLQRQIIEFSDALTPPKPLLPIFPKIRDTVALTMIPEHSKVMQKEHRFCSLADLHSHSSFCISWMCDLRQVK